MKKTLDAREVAHAADVERLDQKKDKTIRDMDTAKQYMSLMVVRAPSDGIFNILPNFRSGGIVSGSRRRRSRRATGRGPAPPSRRFPTSARCASS